MGQTQRIGRIATTVRECGGNLSVVYHETEAVRVRQDEGTVTLDTGGWHTATTASRMNQASNEYNLPYAVHRVDGHIYVTTKFDTYRLPEFGAFTFNDDGEAVTS